MELSLAPLIVESLTITGHSVNFDESVRQFAGATHVRFGEMRRLARQVKSTVDQIGVRTTGLTHAYVRFVNEPSVETYTTLPDCDIKVGSIRINQLITAYGPRIQHDLAGAREGEEMMTRKGIGAVGISIDEILRFRVMDQVSHEFAHAFGIRPGISRLSGRGVAEIEEITDALAIWSIPAGDSRATRTLIHTGFTRLQNKFEDDVQTLGLAIKTVAESVLRHYKLLPLIDCQS
jgi:hypothetical protein